MTLSFAAFHLAGFLVFLFLFIVLTQNLQVFPGALLSLPIKISRPKPPRGVESIFIRAGRRELDVWRMPPAAGEVRPRAAVVFHGNGGWLKHFVFPQLWFSALGITSYGFDYRGFGRSSGWPSEQGIYQDGEAVCRYVLEREGLTPEQLIILGISVGGAPAARAASRLDPKLLVLVAAFTSLPDVVRAKPFFRLFSRFLWYTLPTSSYIKALRSANLLIAHGENDRIIPPSHSRELEKAYRGTGAVRRITAPAAGHNAVFYALRSELARLLIELS